jgi:hypothetical protein
VPYEGKEDIQVRKKWQVSLSLESIRLPGGGGGGGGGGVGCQRPGTFHRG